MYVASRGFWEGALSLEPKSPGGKWVPPTPEKQDKRETKGSQECLSH